MKTLHCLAGTGVRKISSVAIISDREHLSNTDLCDLTIVGSCDIHVYQMSNKVI